MRNKVKVGVVGVGRFGEHHARVYRELPDAELVGVYDAQPSRAAEVAEKYRCRRFERLEELKGAVEAASVAVPTDQHALVTEMLLEAGIDVLVEKPMARTVAEVDRLAQAAEAAGRVLQVGHLERFNPAVEAAREVATTPLFFEAHRLSPFSARSLDVDVVLDLMIHDLDIVLSLVEAEPKEIRAVGLAVLSPKFDIANVRVAFANGCVANFTASRVSTERVRKLRWFQPREYISIDYDRQDTLVISVEKSRGEIGLAHRKLEPKREEPLRRQLIQFLESVRSRKAPAVGAAEGRRALALAHQINEEMRCHGARVQEGMAGRALKLVKV